MNPHSIGEISVRMVGRVSVGKGETGDSVGEKGEVRSFVGEGLRVSGDVGVGEGIGEGVGEVGIVVVLSGETVFF